MNPSSSAQPPAKEQLRAAFSQFLERYQALEKEKEKLMNDFLRETDALIAASLISD